MGGREGEDIGQNCIREAQRGCRLGWVSRGWGTTAIGCKAGVGSWGWGVGGRVGWGRPGRGASRVPAVPAPQPLPAPWSWCECSSSFVRLSSQLPSGLCCTFPPNQSEASAPPPRPPQVPSPPLWPRKPRPALYTSIGWHSLVPKPEKRPQAARPGFPRPSASGSHSASRSFI